MSLNNETYNYLESSKSLETVCAELVKNHKILTDTIMQFEQERHMYNETHKVDIIEIAVRDETLRSSRNEVDTLRATLQGVQGSLQEKVANLEMELANMHKEIDQQAGERACNVVKALIAKNADLELDYSFLPSEYLESIEEWWNEEDVESLELEKKEMIIKEYESLDKHYEHFGGSSHGDSEPDGDDDLFVPSED